MNKINLRLLKQNCPLPDLLKRLGMERYAKSSCPSPFRQDHKASWGVFERSGRWMYKDQATGEVGDEIGLVARLHQLDPHDDFLEVLKLYEEIAKKKALKFPEPLNYTESTPDLTGFGPGTYQQIEALSALRKISMAGLQFAQDRGVLMFGQWQGQEVYGVRDQGGRLGEIRRLDGSNFPAWGNLPAHKSHTLKGSQKNWPLGILEAENCDALALAEGLPDFLALHQYVVEEDAEDRVGPVGMLGAGCLIAEEALPSFKGKHVRIFPHMDEQGVSAAAKWQKQLKEAGARKVDFYDFSAFRFSDGKIVKDLCEFNQLDLQATGQPEERILP